jgi:hypothetical protein
MVALAIGESTSLRADKPAPGTPTSHALILVGLPGDAEHEAAFAQIAEQWQRWLVDALGFGAGDVRVLFGRAGRRGLAQGPASRNAIEREVAALKQKLQAEDRLWVFLLGHGDYDGERASFHLAGPDLHADELGKLFAGITCREQVFWLTNSASGWFVRALSIKGRIVIAATATDEEYNETEFPHALATISRLSARELNSKGKVSLLDVYRRLVKEVEARFAADKRVPTEHAQLDDNGDGIGTEEPVVAGDVGKKPTADGERAAQTFLPLTKKRGQDP